METRSLSAEFKAHLLDIIAQSVVAIDSEGRVLYWNGSAAQIYGWTAEEAHGRHFIELVIPPSGEINATDIIVAVREQGTWAGEVEVERKDRSRLVVFASLTAIISEGEFAGVVAVSHDITEQKVMQTLLARRETRYRAIVSAVPDLIFRFDRDARYLDVAGRVSDLRYPIDQLIGHRARDVVAPHVADSIERSVRSALETGEQVRAEYEAEVHGDVRTRDVIFVRSGPSEVVAVARDITQQKRDRETLDRLLVDLEKRVDERTRELSLAVETLRQEADRRFAAEEQLRKSYVRLQTLVNASPAAMIETDLDGRVLSWSGGAERMFGWTTSEVIGQFNPVVPVDRIDEFRGIIAAVSSGVPMSSVVLERINRAGKRMRFVVSASVTRDASGKPEHLIIVYAKPEMESSAVDEMAERLRKLKSLSTATTKTLDMGQALASLDRELTNSFGITAGALFVAREGMGFEALYAWGDDGMIDVAAIAAVDDRETIVRTASRRKWLCIPLAERNNEQAILALQLPLHASSSDDELFTTVGHDVAQALTNARLFDETRRVNERLQELSRRVLSVQEEERRHIARELHDQIGQMLTGLKMRLQAVHAGNSDPKWLADADELASDLLRRIRTISLELRPPMLDDLGLVAALAAHVTQYSRESGVHVEFRHSDLPPLSHDLATAVFRIVQEALTNVARHAHAKHVALRIWAAAHLLLIEIEDDGCGFTVADLSSSAGIAGMRERASLLGGSCRIDASPGSGTHISVELPLESEGT